MVTISFLYPNRQGARFDLNYYLNTHMPRAIEHLSAHKGFQGVSVERGLTGEAPDAAPPYVALCHYRFDSVEDFLVAMTAHAEFLQGDMSNYTDVAPVIQISAVEIAR